MFSCHRLFYASMRCDVANFRAAWQWFCPLWLCYLERKELRPTAGISLKHAKIHFTHFTWTFSWNHDGIHRIFRTFVCFPASISSQVPCRAGACWAAGKRGDARSITKSLFVDASDFRIHHVDTRVQCVQIFIPHFWSQWVLRRVWILMSRPKHRVQKREDFSDNQESKQWSYWSTRYQAERRFWKIGWTHSSHVHHVFIFQGVFSCLFTFSQDVHDISNTFHGKKSPFITIHRFILVHLIRLQAPSGLWLTFIHDCKSTRFVQILHPLHPLDLIAQLFDLELPWFFQNDFKTVFSEDFVLCDSNGEEHR